MPVSTHAFTVKLIQQSMVVAIESLLDWNKQPIAAYVMIRFYYHDYEGKPYIATQLSCDYSRMREAKSRLSFNLEPFNEHGLVWDVLVPLIDEKSQNEA